MWLNHEYPSSHDHESLNDHDGMDHHRYGFMPHYDIIVVE